jgi:hypothetical protein
MVDEFYPSNLLPSSINSSFITLTAKIKGANNLKDFRLINLVGEAFIRLFQSR